MTKIARLDRRPCLYGEPRLTDAQVRTLLALSRYTTPCSVEDIKLLGGNPRSLACLAQENLATGGVDGGWLITPRGEELLEDIRQHLDKGELA